MSIIEALLFDLYILTYNFYISRDEGILYTGYLIANKTKINDWKNSWREGGWGAFYLFQTEFGYQVNDYQLCSLIKLNSDV